MIITNTDLPNIKDIINIFPDQFVPEKTKLEDEKWIKSTLDHYFNIAVSQYKRNKETFARNYDLVKGIIGWHDFYYKEAEPVVKDFMHEISGGSTLPPHIKHYPFVNRPINTMVGELSQRPDNHRVRAFDDESKSEELEYKTKLVNDLVLQQARNQIMQDMAVEGTQLSEEELEELTVEKVQDYLTDFTSLAERWGNHTLTALKPGLNMKDKSEEAFRDLLISSREFFHIYEDNSKRGFNCVVANGVNVFHSPSNNQKYSKHWYYGGTIEVMELSQIIEEITDITKEEIDHLVKQQANPGLTTKSNFDSTLVGIDTIKYDTYSPLIEQEKDILAFELQQDDNSDKDMNGLLSSTNGVYNPSPLSQRFSVMRVYYCSKKKIGKLTYIDEEGQLQVMLVDEHYEEGTPGEEAIEWGYVNQWYMGTKIGTDIYKNKPFKLLDYCPIIGVTHEIKNTQARSLIDLIKPFQSVYNVMWNQIWELSEKEIGVVLKINLRKIPLPKGEDGKVDDSQDAITEWMNEAREMGVVFEDDSPENMRTPGNNTNLSQAVDLTRSKEIEWRLKAAVAVKQEAMDLIGMSDARMGGVAATQTATGTQTELTQSFAQTEPYFAQHEYVLDMVYQAILDAAQYIESQKPQSTTSYITASGESMFLQVMGQDIKLRDLHVFSTSRNEDTRLFQEIRSLSQAMLQNGASAYEIIELYSTNSIRQMKKVFKSLKEKQEEFAQNQQQIEGQAQQVDMQTRQAELEQTERFHQDEMAMEKYKTDVKANTDLATAQIDTYFKAPTTDADGDGTPDIMEIASHALSIQEVIDKRDLEGKRISLDMQKHLNEQKNKAEEHKLRRKELDIQEKNQKNDEKIQGMKLQEAKIKLQATRAAARKKTQESKKSNK